MRTFIALPAMYDGAKARRITKVGRVELLRVIEEPPYWFVRIVGFNEERDRARFLRAGSKFGNGYWRFGFLDKARTKFEQLAEQPETIKEQKAAVILREKNKQRFEKQVLEGKMHSFGKSAGKGQS